jgi:arabinogalactan endo-1,4-beta-galactosidase
MKKFITVICLIAFAACNKNTTGTTPTTPVTPTTPTSPIAANAWYGGADLSFLPTIQQAGTQFYDSTGAKPALAIFKEYGCNLVRVRLWYNPADVHSSLTEVLAFCQSIQQAGMQILLDFHMSDTWADPGHQATPAAWSGLSLGVLEDSVSAYTQRVIGLLIAQNTPPAIVQVGNEINSGILWPTGLINSNSDPNWPNFAALIKSGIAGVKAADTGNKIAIMLHYAEVDGAASFFTNMNQNNVPYDIIGLSYYPWWSEPDFNYISGQLDQLAANFNKRIFIAETAYPWTLGWNDNTNNTIGDSSQLMPGYPSTPQGQLQYLQQLKSIVAGLPNNQGLGFCYWEPDWVAYLGPTATNGSDWENLTFFDFTNKVLPAMQVYGQ